MPCSTEPTTGMRWDMPPKTEVSIHELLCSEPLVKGEIYSLKHGAGLGPKTEFSEIPLDALPVLLNPSLGLYSFLLLLFVLLKRDGIFK